ncbi:tyrosine-protein phosphatase 99A-like [Pollicipes pollicipes]|uniref:tyrosine-protein phosphatase 99A-like n=1 Tax=Pollicipes pollicipes TaxID=41117 RepID=UPI0018853AB5|nr:tyrosine-protein phosphatase 99A-like [Pollicipes pollicipes]
MQYTLKNLEPFSNYSIAVKAFTRSVEGRESAALAVTTDVSAPAAPRLTSLACQPDAALLLAWRPPGRVRGRIDFYVVGYRTGQAAALTELQVTADSAEQESMFLLPNLTAGAVYEVRVRAATRSLHRPAVLLRSPCAFLLALLALAIWRRYFQSSYYYSLDEPVTARAPVTSDPGWELDGPNGSAGPIPADAFPVHVASLHADSDIGFCKEYDEVLAHTMKLELSSNVSQTEENKQKIDTRTLMPRRGDYINANYIDGFLVRNQYIGAQGPLTGTFAAFWRLIWEQRIQIVVMITNLVERNRVKKV